MSLGLPTLWTVEEAHYLLSRMNAGNVGLATQMPTTAELNPNSINAAQLQTIRSALTGDVAYSQGAGVRNKMSIENYRADSTQKRKLEELRAGYQARQLRLEDQISALQAQLATMTSGGASADALKQQQAAINTKTTQLTQLDTLITNTDDQISKLNATPPTFDKPDLPAQSTATLPVTGFDHVMGELADTTGMFRSPNLQATLALDNYIQMQYLIISRQLTLLRDEAGREDRVVFLEVPTGIYAVTGPGNGKSVEVRWEATRWAKACNPYRLGADPWDVDEKGQKHKDTSFLHVFSTTKNVDACPNATSGNETELKKTTDNAEKDAWTWMPVVSPDDRLRVRAIELVPQQAAINVDQFVGKSNSSAFSAVFSWISGFGAQARYQRQHDLAQRFITSEAHTSAFGKGSNVFGWNFEPLPYEKRLSGGERTTYAAVAVAKDAVAIELHGVACYGGVKSLPAQPVADQDHLPQSLDPGDKKRCVERTEVVYIPSLRDMHPSIQSLGYHTATVGQRITVTLHGTRISPQIGVLVNGVELRKEVAIAQHNADNPTVAPPEVNGVSGSFEYVNSEFAILNFSVRDSAHQPVITLVGPGFTQNLELKELDHYVPGENPPSKKCSDFPMFASLLTVSGMSAAALDTTNRILSLRLDGSGLRNQVVTLQSGGVPGMKNCSSDIFCRLSWSFTDLSEADILTRASWTFSVIPVAVTEFAVPVDVSFDNPLLVKFDRSAPPKPSWNLKADGTVDTLHLEVAGTNLDPSLTYTIAGEDGSYQAGDKPSFAPGKVIFDSPAPDPKVTSIRLSANRAGTPLGDTLSAIKLPSRPPPPKPAATTGN